MFQRYTYSARRAIFFARSEACEYSTPTIEMEHILSGLLRQDESFIRYVLENSQISVQWLYVRINEQRKWFAWIYTVDNPPLSDESRRTLNFAEEANYLQHQHIGLGHLFLGLLREQKNNAKGILHESNLEIEKVREKILEFYRTDSNLDN